MIQQYDVNLLVNTETRCLGNSNHGWHRCASAWHCLRTSWRRSWRKHDLASAAPMSASVPWLDHRLQAIESHTWLIAEKHFTSQIFHDFILTLVVFESHSALDQYSSTSIMHSQTSFTSRSSFWPATFLGSTSLKRCKSSRAAWNKQHGAAVCYESKCCDVISTSLGVGSFGGKAEGPSKKQSWRWKN